MSMIKREVTAGVACIKLCNLKAFRFVFFILLILAGTLLYSQIKDTDWEMVGRFMQVILASVNWVMTSAVLYVIFQCKIDPFHMAQVFLVSSIAASMVHIPAGMGVIESVFLFFFAGALPKEEIVASLLMYRFFFYLLPLVVAIAFYILMEIRHR